jgi:hypothetical protein
MERLVISPMKYCKSPTRLRIVDHMLFFSCIHELIVTDYAGVMAKGNS